MNNQESVIKYATAAARANSLEVQSALAIFGRTGGEEWRPLRVALEVLAAGGESVAHDGSTRMERVTAAVAALGAWDGPRSVSR